MVPRGYRPTRPEFSAISRGRRHASKHFSVVYTTASSPRVAIVIPKKVAPTAVARHELKRRIAPLVVAWVANHSHCRVVVYAKAKAAALSPAALRVEIAELLGTL